MHVKAVITVILGLVFQLAQMLPAAVITSPCASHGESCACCKAARSCECAENSDNHEKPAPAPLETGSLLKAPAAKSGETHLSLAPCDDVAPNRSATVSPRTGSAVGYRGVRLSVAFCTFAI